MKKYFALIMLLFLAVPLALIAQESEVPVEPGFNWWLIISGALAVLTTIFGATVKKFKAKFKDVINLGKEALDVVFVLSDALDDNNVDAEEVAELKKAIAEVKVAWKKIWNKA